MTYFLPKNEVEYLDIDKYLELQKKLPTINKDDLPTELATHATTYSYYHGLMIWQKRKLDLMASNAQAMYSLIKNNELLKNKSNGAKATATYLEDFVQSDEGYIELKHKVIYQEEIYGYLKAICAMLEHKKDMLIQLSANLRSETKLYN
jgi:hypothetical protein